VLLGAGHNLQAVLRSKDIAVSVGVNTHVGLIAPLPAERPIGAVQIRKGKVLNQIRLVAQMQSAADGCFGYWLAGRVGHDFS